MAKLLKCSRCKDSKPPSEFYKAKNKKGRQSWCKACNIKDGRRRRADLKRYETPLPFKEKKAPRGTKSRPCLGNCGAWKKSKKAWMCRSCSGSQGRRIQRERAMYG